LQLPEFPFFIIFNARNIQALFNTNLISMQRYVETLYVATYL